MGQAAPPNELIVRTTKTDRIRTATACYPRDQVTYRGYRLNPKAGKYAGFSRADFAAIVKEQVRLKTL